jgi:hypothetical protein
VRSLLIAVAACAVAFLLAGCGGSSPESAATTSAATTTRTPSSPSATATRTAYASALASLCLKRLASLEAIGNPHSPDELTRLLPRQLTVMRRFSTQSKALRAPAAQAKAKKDFDRFYATYLDGQIYALKTLRTKSYNGYFTVVSSALMWQTQAEKTARRIGAVECARRPFANA